MNNKQPILVVAGEPSGDQAAARVIRAIQGARPGIRFFGLGGAALEAAGVELVEHISNLSVMGVAASIRAAGPVAQCWVRLRQAIAANRPAVALLIDSPELNLPLARILRSNGIRVVYYICPQVWAWRKGRLALLRNRVDQAALILPFEKTLYDHAGVPSQFVGHPIIDEPAPNRAVLSRLKSELRIGEEPVIALLPGSRPSEWRHHGPAMISAAQQLTAKNVRAFIAPLGIGTRRKIPAGQRLPNRFSARELLAIADGAIVASGTATLEAAVLGVPLAVVYRTDPLTYFAGRRLLKLPYVALPNWIGGEKVVRELIQSEVNADSVAEAALELLAPDERQRQKAVLDKTKRALGPPGAASRVAALVLERLV